MARPRLIILVRHAQSEGNKNRDIHQTIPDHRVKLTGEGWSQALDAGRRLRKLLHADDTLHFFTSPYRRTRETTEGILETLTSDEPEPSPFKRANIKVYEEPRLREQDFGNFQPCSAEMERMWQERADYGHFFYRIPNGESAADAYDRISGFNESLWREFNDNNFASVCVIVTHGLMSRVFLMKWYHFSVEYFEDLRNVNHCEFLIMRKDDNGKYLLENKLRTWSELRKERAALKGKDKQDKQDSLSKLEKADQSERRTKLGRTASYVPFRRWGGCPDGCTHGHSSGWDQTNQRPSSRDVLKHADHVTGASKHASITALPPVSDESDVEQPAPSRRPMIKRFQSFISDAGQERGEYGDFDLYSSSDSDDTAGRPRIDMTRVAQGDVSSPDGTPSFISPDYRSRFFNSPRAPNFTHDASAEGGPSDNVMHVAESGFASCTGDHGNQHPVGTAGFCGPISSYDTVGGKEKTGDEPKTADSGEFSDADEQEQSIRGSVY